MGITGQRAFLLGPIAILIGLVASGPILAAPVTGGTGPGGVGLTDGSSDLAVWLKADALVGHIGDGASVGGAGSQWTDASGSGNHGAETDSARYPTFCSSGSRLLNGNPIVEFDGSDDRLYLGSPTILTLTDLGSDISVFTVTKLDNFDNYRNCVIAGYDRGAGGFAVDVPNDGDIRYRVSHRNADSSATRVSFVRGPSTPSLTDPDLISVVSGPSAIEMRLNGSVEVSSTYNNVNPTPDDRVASGGVDINPFCNPYDGSFAEVVVFSTNVNAAERIVIQNYLQAKYNDSTADNMTIADDKYAGDTTAAGDYDQDVFGIGRVDGSNQLTNSGSAGLGFEASGTLTDGQFVMAGHKVQNNSLTTDDMPPGWERWDRVWFVDETNELGVDLQMAFDFSDAGLDSPGSGRLFDLLYSPTNTFAFELLELPATVDGDRVTFTLPAAMLEDGYYTLGVVPEPSSAALLVLGLAGLGLCGWRKRRAK